MAAYIPIGKAPWGHLGGRSPLWLLVHRPVLRGLQQCLCRRDGPCSSCVNNLWRAGRQRGLGVGCGDIVGCGLCPSLGSQGQAVQRVGGRQVGTGAAHPKILLWLRLAASFTPRRVCSCFLLLDFAPVSAMRGKFPGQLVGNGKMEEKEEEPSFVYSLSTCLVATPEVFITPFRMQLLLLCVSTHELYSFFWDALISFSLLSGLEGAGWIMEDLPVVAAVGVSGSSQSLHRTPSPCSPLVSLLLLPNFCCNPLKDPWAAAPASPVCSLPSTEEINFAWI